MQFEYALAINKLHPGYLVYLYILCPTSYVNVKKKSSLIEFNLVVIIFMKAISGYKVRQDKKGKNISSIRRGWGCWSWRWKRVFNLTHQTRYFLKKLTPITTKKYFKEVILMVFRIQTWSWHIQWWRQIPIQFWSYLIYGRRWIFMCHKLSW